MNFFSLIKDVLSKVSVRDIQWIHPTLFAMTWLRKPAFLLPLLERSISFYHQWKCFASEWVTSISIKTKILHSRYELPNMYQDHNHGQFFDQKSSLEPSLQVSYKRKRYQSARRTCITLYIFRKLRCWQLQS